MLPDGWVQPAAPWYQYWIPLSLTFLMGAPFGYLGGSLARRMTGLVETRASVFTGPTIDMLLGGAWWSLSAVLRSWDFPMTLVRSLVGAFLLAMVYECCVAALWKLNRTTPRD